MSNKLQKLPASNLPTTTVNQTGEKNIHISHAENVSQTVNMHYTVWQQSPNGGRTKVSQTLNLDYYNLFVIGCETFERDHFLVPKDRALTKGNLPDDLFEKYASLSDEAKEEIKKIPAIFASENHHYYGRAGKDQLAIYGFITDIKVQDNGVKIYFYPLNHIPQQKLNDLAFELGIRGSTAFNELNRTHWLIKRINLIEVLKDAGISVLAPT
ncbi:Hypothetical protein DPCES_3578 [Desulfitobacterium hafniense]|uniref:Uncharacterized protein n=1 Tax=Desulfitobacterium hafniense TaxID=49338 RepID=A0A098B3N6_DESHA|nr:hypothetical protein [Desulfitobacterium hafniense]CDX03464.1 Hypothetical protein DPCES_3578 [Desulfitobacterium hafniense]